MISKLFIIISFVLISFFCLATKSSQSQHVENLKDSTAPPEEEEEAHADNHENSTSLHGTIAKSKIGSIRKKLRGPSLASVKDRISHRQGMLENFMTNRIFEKLDKLCKTDESIVGEIVNCYQKNEQFMMILQGEQGKKCSAELAKAHNKPEELIQLNNSTKYKEFICQNWKVFDDISACAYRKTVELSNWKSIKNLVKTKVNVSTCFLSVLNKASDTDRVVENVLNEISKVCKENVKVLDEVVSCFHKNENHIKALTSSKCYEDVYKEPFESENLNKTKELMCNDMHQLDQVTGCAYKKLTQGINQTEADNITNSLMEIGVCLTNHLNIRKT